MNWVDAGKEKAAIVAANQAGMQKEVIDPVYFTDEYPREGCGLSIVVGIDGCSMTVHAPNGRAIESYLPSSEEVGRYVQEWVSGMVPRLRPSDRAPGQLSPDKAG